MPANWLIDPIQQNFELVVTALLVMILIAILITIVVLARKRSANNQPNVLTVDTVSLTEAVQRITNASAHAAQVSAVLSLVEQLEEHPDALERIREYPQLVVAATRVHYVNTLGSDLQYAQDQLSKAHRGQLNARYSYDRNRAIKAEQALVDALQAKLETAEAATRPPSGPNLRVV